MGSSFNGPVSFGDGPVSGRDVNITIHR